MTNIWELSDAQRRKDFIRQWRDDLAANLKIAAPRKELHEMDCRECASEEYAAVVSANLAAAQALGSRFVLEPAPLSRLALENVGVHVPLSAIAPPPDSDF